VGSFAAWIKDQAHRDDAVGYFARYWTDLKIGRISTPTGIRRELEKAGQHITRHPDERAQASLGAAMSGYALAVKEYHQANALAVAIETGAVPEGTAMTEQPGDGTFEAPELVTPDTGRADDPDYKRRAHAQAYGATDENGQTPDLDALAGPETTSTGDVLAAHQKALDGVQPVLPGEFELSKDETGPKITRRRASRAKAAPEKAAAPADLGGLPESRIERVENALVTLSHGLLELMEQNRRILALLEHQGGYDEPIDWQAVFSAADHSA
jgi:hypothetical protein